MNRAIARRTMFERRSDVELFLERLGETVAKGLLEVHCYTVMTTHFHLLVRSPVGEMPRALHHLQLNYSRYFNRTRKRDGPLVRGRYRSLLVDTPAYRRVLIGYIDANPVDAGIVDRPDAYAFRSCRAYVTGAAPEWLSRDTVHSEIRALTGARAIDGARYVDVFGRRFTQAQRELVEHRIRSRSQVCAPVEDLLGAPSSTMADWLRRKALLADGTLPGVAMVAASSIDEIVREAQVEAPAEAPAAHRRTPWADATRATLLADLSGQTQRQIAARMNISRDAARRLVARGRSAVAHDEGFAAQLGQLGREAAIRTYGTFLQPNGDGAREAADVDGEHCEVAHFEPGSVRAGA